jgi:tetratricopeptide (TPR) repeat protein
MSQGNLGYTLTMLGQFDKALACHSESLALRQKISGEEGTAWSHSDIGLIYYLADNMDAAEASHKKSLEIWEKEDFKLGMALAHLYLGDILAARENKEHAAEHYRTSIEIAKEYGHKSPHFSSMVGLFEIRAAYESQFAELEALAGQIGRSDLLMDVYRLRAEYAIGRGDLESAASLIGKAEEIGKSAEQGVTIEMEAATVKMAKAKLLAAQGDKNAARELAADVVRRFKRRGRRFEAKRAEQWARGL